MVSLKEAVSAAMSAVEDLYKGQPVTGMLLEEIELTEDEHYWLITVGFDIKKDSVPLTPLDALALPKSELERKYKIFKIDSEQGNVVSMKMRSA